MVPAALPHKGCFEPIYDANGLSASKVLPDGLVKCWSESSGYTFGHGPQDAFGDSAHFVTELILWRPCNWCRLGPASALHGPERAREIEGGLYRKGSGGWL